MKKILITIAVVMLAMTAMSALTGCSSCGHKAKAKATHECSAACSDACKGAHAKVSEKACCDYAGTAACCGKNAPDAKV